MAKLSWNRDTNQISVLTGGLGGASLEAALGDELIQLIVCQGTDNTPVLLDASRRLCLVIRDPNNLKNGYVGGPAYFPRGAPAADGYLTTVSTNTPFAVALLHAALNDASAELSSAPAKAKIIDLPQSGGAKFESLPFDWLITPAFFDPGTPPPDIIELYPSAGQLTAAIELAGEAEPGLGNPTANGMILSSTTSGVRSWIALGNAFTGDLTIGGVFYGSGAGLTNLPPAALSSPVPVAKGGTGSTTATAGLAALGGAPSASPTFTGTVTIPAGAAIAGYAPTASPTFTGTVTIPAGAAIAGYATLANPTFIGTVTIPAGASIAGYAPVASPTFTGTVTIPAGAAIAGYARRLSPIFPGPVTAATWPRSTRPARTRSTPSPASPASPSMVTMCRGLSRSPSAQSPPGP